MSGGSGKKELSAKATANKTTAAKGPSACFKVQSYAVRMGDMVSLCEVARIREVSGRSSSRKAFYAFGCISLLSVSL